jgi:hypothetical protein
MGKFQKGILGGFSGKVGNVVGVRWRGRDIMRSLPQRGNYQPTELQIDQRERFSTVVAFLTPIKDLILDPVEGYLINYLKVLISKGDLRGINNATATPDAGQQVTISWSDNSGQGNASATDQLVVVAYSPGLDLFEVANPAGTRDLTTVQLPLPAYWATQEVQLWATFVTADEKLAATSTYLGAVTLT